MLLSVATVWPCRLRWFDSVEIAPLEEAPLSSPNCTAANETPLPSLPMRAMTRTPLEHLENRAENTSFQPTVVDLT